MIYGDRFRDYGGITVITVTDYGDKITVTVHLFNLIVAHGPIKMDVLKG